MAAGIYAIVNTVNGNVYVGSSTDIVVRLETHFHLLDDNKHFNRALQQDYKKYPDKFACQTLEIVPNTEQLAQREQTWLRRMKHTTVYNVWQTIHRKR